MATPTTTDSGKNTDSPDAQTAPDTLNGTVPDGEEDSASKSDAATSGGSSGGDGDGSPAAGAGSGGGSGGETEELRTEQTLETERDAENPPKEAAAPWADPGGSAAKDKSKCWDSEKKTLCGLVLMDWCNWLLLYVLLYAITGGFAVGGFAVFLHMRAGETELGKGGSPFITPCAEESGSFLSHMPGLAVHPPHVSRLIELKYNEDKKLSNNTEAEEKVRKAVMDSMPNADMSVDEFGQCACKGDKEKCAFGWDGGQPCFAVTVNRIFNWMPPYDPLFLRCQANLTKTVFEWDVFPRKGVNVPFFNNTSCDQRRGLFLISPPAFAPLDHKHEGAFPDGDPANMLELTCKLEARNVNGTNGDPIVLGHTHYSKESVTGMVYIHLYSSSSALLPLSSLLVAALFALALH